MTKENTKILIVEDDPATTLLLKKYIDKMNFKVSDSVSSGESCLNSIKSNPPDLILMDINIEGDIDGIETFPMPKCPQTLKQLEINYIKNRLLANNGNQAKTAKELNVPRSTLNDQLRRFNIDSSQYLNSFIFS